MITYVTDLLIIPKDNPLLKEIVKAAKKENKKAGVKLLKIKHIKR